MKSLTDWSIEAIESIKDAKPLQYRRMMRRIGRMNAAEREEFEDDLAAKLADCPRCRAAGVAINSQFVCGDVIGIDPDNLRKWFDLLLEYLPLFLKLFM